MSSDTTADCAGQSVPSSVTPKQRRKSLGHKRRSTNACFNAFKSPLQKKVKTTSKPCHTTAEDQLLLAKDVIALEEESKDLEQQICELEKDYKEDDLQMHITALHDYNEIKDVTQMVLGRLAEWKGTTTSSLYEEFGLATDD